MNSQSKIFLVLIFVGVGFFSFTSFAEAASRFWVGGTGNWDASDTTHWAASSGGGGGASVPGSGDTVTFDGSSGGGTVTVTAAVNVTSITMGAFTGTLDFNGQTINLSSFSMTGTGTRTLTMGSSAINVSGTGTAWNATTLTNCTISSNTATITMSGAGGTFQSPSGTNWNGLSLSATGSGQFTLSADANTFANVTRTGTAVKTDFFVIPRFTVTGTLTLAGNSSVNRILVLSNTVGTARTITNTGATMTWSNVDFMDVDLSTAYDCSGITGGCGDAGGNTDITFTTGQTNYWVGGTGNWDDVNEWANSSGGTAGTGRVPLPQDDVVFDNGSFNGTSQTVSTNMPRMGTNIDWSGYNEGQTPTWALNITNYTHYGSITLISGMNLTSAAVVQNFQGRGSHTLTSAGKSWGSHITISMVGGTLTLQDSLTTTNQITFTNGTFDANDFNVTANNVLISGSGVRTLNMGSGTWTVTTTGGAWNASGTSNLTFNRETSTIVVSNTTATAKTFAGNGLTYYNLTITGDDVTITGNNTFNILTQDNGGEAEGLIIGTGSTQTVTEFADGSSCQSGAVCLLNGVAGGGAETLSDSSGNNCIDWFTITNTTVSGGASWYAGANSTDGTGNSGWTFSACPGGGATSTESSVQVRGGVKARGGVKFR